MPLGNVWSFPSKKMSYAATLDAMKALAEEISKVTGRYKEFDHPIDINWVLNPLYLKAAADVSGRLHLPDPISKLCTLVTASPFDAAVHDAFGKAYNLNCYHTYGPEFMNHDLSYYPGSEYKNEYPSRYIRQEPKRTCPYTIWSLQLIRSRNPMSPGAWMTACLRFISVLRRDYTYVRNLLIQAQMV